MLSAVSDLGLTLITGGFTIGAVIVTFAGTALLDRARARRAAKESRDAAIAEVLAGLDGPGAGGSGDPRSSSAPHESSRRRPSTHAPSPGRIRCHFRMIRKITTPAGPCLTSSSMARRVVLAHPARAISLNVVHRFAARETR